MQGIYTYIPETNHVPREHCVAVILMLLFMVCRSLVPALTPFLHYYYYYYYYYCYYSVEITNKMQPCNRIYYSTVHWQLNMFWEAYCSSWALTVFAASGLHTHVVTGRSQFPLRLDYGRSPHAYVNQRLQIQLGLLMMSGMPLETCSAVNERWNYKFCYKVASCWLFLLSEFPLRLDYGRSPHAYVNQRRQIQLELLMMSGVQLETC